MVYYTLYQITCLVNNKIYVGVHKTHKLDDGYMGSGKVIKAAIAKHGLDNFRKDILGTYDTAKEMYAAEALVVTDAFLVREDTYNLRRGGTGGFDYINKNGIPKFKGHKHNEYTKRLIGNKSSGRVFNEETRNKISKNNWARSNPEEQKKHASLISKGRIRSIETRNKISSSLIGKTKGLKKEIVKCNFCGQSGGINIMHRWHFDNCKMRN